MSVTALIKTAMSHNEGFKKRKIELKDNLLYLMSLIGGHHPNGGWEIPFMATFNYKQYLEEWESFFDLVQNEHLDKQWYNPFTNRHIYNFIRVLPIKVLSHRIYTTFMDNVWFGQLAYNDETEAILNMDWLNVPLVFDKKQYEQLEYIGKTTKSKKYQKFLLFAKAGLKFFDKFEETEENLLRNYHVTTTRYNDLEKEHTTGQAQVDSMQNMRYELLVIDALCTIPHALYHPLTYRRNLILEDEDRLKLNDILGEALNDVERYIYILSTSLDPIELTFTMKAFMGCNIESQQAFVLTKGFQVLAERFRYYTGLEPYQLIAEIGVEDNPELAKSVRVHQDGLRATIDQLNVLAKDSASEPKHRWIRTLDGEFFVQEDKHLITDTQEDKETGETTTTERIETVYNFIKTAVGNETETSLIETMSVYGKTLNPEDRRYVDTQAGERGDIGTETDKSLEELNDSIKLKREQLGYAHLGHTTDGYSLKAIELEAKRWTDEVIARWKRETGSLILGYSREPEGNVDEEAEKTGTPPVTGEETESTREEVEMGSDQYDSVSIDTVHPVDSDD